MYQGRELPPSKCPVLTVPPWVWDMLDLGHMIHEGTVRLTDVDAQTWQLAVSTRAAYDAHKAAAEETERKRKETLRQATSAAIARRKA